MKHIPNFLIPLLILISILTAVLYLQPSFTLFHPEGLIAQKESQLMTLFIFIMLSVAIPSVLLTFFTAWKFRATNTKATYTPNADSNKWLEVLWWLIPMLIILVMATITWNMTHLLDPFKQVKSTTPPLTIQVVALRWKWLFIYPKQHIATVNFIAFPVNSPINFQLTAGDAPMNSFWIPSLGGQMYAMSGMVNQLHLQADNMGNYQGSTAEISGAGFAGMRFTAKVITQKDFDTWVNQIQKSHNPLTQDVYQQLSKPSEDTPPTFYSSVSNDFYTTIVMKYMGPPKVMDHD